MKFPKSLRMESLMIRQRGALRLMFCKPGPPKNSNAEWKLEKIMFNGIMVM